MSHRPAEFEDILAVCTDAVLQGDLTVDECLTRYPQFAAELAPLLRVSVLTHRLKSPAMSAGSVRELEAVLRARMAAAAPGRPVTTGRHRGQPRGTQVLSLQPWARAVAAVLIAVLLIFGSGAGLVSASANTLPGDSLYSVKLLWEDIRLILAQLSSRLAEFSIEIAEERAQEVQKLAADGRLTESALNTLTVAVQRALNANTDGQRAALMSVFLENLRIKLANLQVPLSSQGAYDAMLLVLNTPPPTQPDTPTVTWTATATSTLELVRFTATFDAVLETTAEFTATGTRTADTLATPATSATATLRFPPTATNTPTATFTATRTPTPTLSDAITSATPTATWTALPRFATVVPTTPTPFVAPPVATYPPTSTPDYALTLPVRQTQQAVYLTQTAGPPLSTSTSVP